MMVGCIIRRDQFVNNKKLLQLHMFCVYIECSAVQGYFILKFIIFFFLLIFIRIYARYPMRLNFVISFRLNK